jgi:hypothetical protein
MSSYRRLLPNLARGSLAFPELLDHYRPRLNLSRRELEETSARAHFLSGLEARQYTAIFGIGGCKFSVGDNGGRG